MRIITLFLKLSLVNENYLPGGSPFKSKYIFSPVMPKNEEFFMNLRRVEPLIFFNFSHRPGVPLQNLNTINFENKGKSDFLLCE